MWFWKIYSLSCPLAKSYIGADISQAQLDLARKKVEGLENVKLIKNDFDKLPLEDESVDIIFSSWGSLCY